MNEGRKGGRINDRREEGRRRREKSSGGSRSIREKRRWKGYKTRKERRKDRRIRNRTARKDA